MSSEYAVVNPATGEQLATYPALSDADVEQKLTASESAYRRWREMPVAERAALAFQAPTEEPLPVNSRFHVQWYT